MNVLGCYFFSLHDIVDGIKTYTIPLNVTEIRICNLCVVGPPHVELFKF